MGKERELTNYRADLLEDLRDPEYAALYVRSACESGSSEEFLVALRDVAEAKKISAVAQETNLNRENLYKMLSESGNPRLKSLDAVLESLGLRLSVEAIATTSRDLRPNRQNAQPVIDAKYLSGSCANSTEAILPDTPTIGTFAFMRYPHSAAGFIHWSGPQMPNSNQAIPPIFGGNAGNQTSTFELTGR